LETQLQGSVYNRKLKYAEERGENLNYSDLNITTGLEINHGDAQPIKTQVKVDKILKEKDEMKMETIASSGYAHDIYSIRIFATKM